MDIICHGSSLWLTSDMLLGFHGRIVMVVSWNLADCGVVGEHVAGNDVTVTPPLPSARLTFG